MDWHRGGGGVQAGAPEARGFKAWPLLRRCWRHPFPVPIWGCVPVLEGTCVHGLFWCSTGAHAMSAHDPLQVCVAVITPDVGHVGAVRRRSCGAPAEVQGVGRRLQRTAPQDTEHIGGLGGRRMAKRKRTEGNTGGQGLFRSNPTSGL